MHFSLQFKKNSLSLHLQYLCEAEILTTMQVQEIDY